MKKLFVSVPMKGRSDEEIKHSFLKMHHIAEVFEGEELELINSWLCEDPSMNCNVAVWFLGKSLEKLAEADIFIGINESCANSGCWLESEAARLYGIKSYKVPAEYIKIKEKEND